MHVLGITRRTVAPESYTLMHTPSLDSSAEQLGTKSRYTAKCENKVAEISAPMVFGSKPSGLPGELRGQRTPNNFLGICGSRPTPGSTEDLQVTGASATSFLHLVVSKVTNKRSDRHPPHKKTKIEAVCFGRLAYHVVNKDGVQD